MFQEMVGVCWGESGSSKLAENAVKANVKYYIIKVALEIKCV